MRDTVPIVSFVALGRLGAFEAFLRAAERVRSFELVVQDHAIGDECTVAVVADDGHALVRRGRLSGREDPRAGLEVDVLDVTVAARNLERKGLKSLTVPKITWRRSTSP
jgi:hypothetical protein